MNAWNLTTSSSVNSTAVMAAENVSLEDGKNHFSAGSRQLSTQILHSFTYAVGSVGSVANGFVLLALLCARQSRHKNINVFIMNQTVLDLLSCLFLILTIVFVRFETSSIASQWIICLLFQTNTVVAVASYSSIFGLVVITVERYVKIVHPVVHRNHYRRWMTYAGVILPWVDGCCCYLIPSWSTVKMINGKCISFKWPITAMYNAYRIVMFVWHYVMPPAIFLFAYWRIIGIIRGRQRAVAPTTAANTGDGQQKLKRNMNVVKTMITIVICFCICYLPYNVHNSSSPFCSGLDHTCFGFMSFQLGIKYVFIKIRVYAQLVTKQYGLHVYDSSPTFSIFFYYLFMFPFEG